MYKKCGMLLLFSQLIILAAFFTVQAVSVNRIASTPAFQIRFLEDFGAVEKVSTLGSVKENVSGQRVVDCQVLSLKDHISESDYDALLRIVEAEAGCEDMKGRILIANVILNRVEDSAFPDSIEGVITQKEKGSYQFSPVANGRYRSVRVSEETIEAVNRALSGEDLSQGALYFAARKYADPDKMRWFDNHLTRLFAHGGHEFFC